MKFPSAESSISTSLAPSDLQFSWKYKCSRDTYIILFYCLRYIVGKKATIRNQYNQVPHLAQDTTWESDKTQENITYIYKRTKRLALSQQVTTRLKWTDKATWYTQNINNKKDPQKKYRLGTLSHWRGTVFALRFNDSGPIPASGS